MLPAKQSRITEKPVIPRRRFVFLSWIRNINGLENATPLVIDKIIKTENIKAEEKEIDAKIKEQAESVDKTFEEYKKSIDPRQVEYITSDIIVTKLFDFLKANNEMYTDDAKEAKKPAAKKPVAKQSAAKETAAKKPAAKKPAAKKTAAKKTAAKTDKDE